MIGALIALGVCLILVGAPIWLIIHGQHQQRRRTIAAELAAAFSEAKIIDGWLIMPCRSTPELVYAQCLGCRRSTNYRNPYHGLPLSDAAIRAYLARLPACGHREKAA